MEDKYYDIIAKKLDGYYINDCDMVTFNFSVFKWMENLFGISRLDSGEILRKWLSDNFQGDITICYPINDDESTIVDYNINGSYVVAEDYDVINRI